MAADSKKQPKDNKDLPLTERKMFVLLVLLSMTVALLSYVTPLRGVFHSEYGVFSNAAVLFYMLAFGYGLKGIYALNLENWKRWRPLAIISLLALFMAGEELHWGLSFLLEGERQWPVQNIRDLLALSLLDVPDKAGLVLTGFIAGARLLLVLLLIYGAGTAFYYRAHLLMLYKKCRLHPAFFYGGVFAGLLVLTVLMRAGMAPGGAALGGALRLSMALAFLMGSLQFLEKK